MWCLWRYEARQHLEGTRGGEPNTVGLQNVPLALERLVFELLL